MCGILAVQTCTSRVSSCRSIADHCSPLLADRRYRKPGGNDCRPAPTLQVSPCRPRCEPGHIQQIQIHMRDSRAHATYTRFVQVMGQTGVLALSSKVLGLVREQILSTSFGLGGLADAFSITSTIPLLALSGVGGLNGAIHCAMAATFKHMEPERPVGPPAGRLHDSLALGSGWTPEYLRRLVNVCNARLGLIMGLFALLLAACAPGVVAVLAPGLIAQHHHAAVRMLQVMSPVILLSGWIGVNIGALTIMNQTLVPSALSLIGNVAFICLIVSRIPVQGAVHLGLAVVASAVAQWAVSHATLQQRWPKVQPGLGDSMQHDHAALFRRMLGVASPALLTTCAVHSSSWADLVAASYLPGAASTISYACVLGMAPYGILSAGFLTPLLQVLPQVHHSEHVAVLLLRLPTLLRLVLPTAASLTILAPQAVTLAFSGGAFQAQEVTHVAALLPFVQLSAAVGMLRDLLFRLHYVRGSGWIVLRLQLAMLAMNAGMNAAVLALGWGAAGIIGSTAVASAVGALLAGTMLACKSGHDKLIWRLVWDTFKAMAATCLSAGIAMWFMGGIPVVTDRWTALRTCSEFAVWMSGAYAVSMCVVGAAADGPGL